MVGEIKINYIGGKVFPNNFILYDDEVKQVIRVNEKTVVINTPDGEKRISKEEIDGYIVKFTVAVKGKQPKVFDLSYSDYNLVDLTEKIVEGYTVQVKTRARVGETIRISCLETVDKYDLIDFNQRFGVITNRNNSFFDIELRNKTVLRGIHRTKFTVVNDKDSRIFFKLICDCCGR